MVGALGLAGLRWGGAGVPSAVASLRTHTRWGSRGAAAGRSRRARTACGSSSCTCRSRGPWCCAHTHTAGCRHARSTGWRAGCTCTWGDTGRGEAAVSGWAAVLAPSRAGRVSAVAGKGPLRPPIQPAKTLFWDKHPRHTILSPSRKRCSWLLPLTGWSQMLYF